MKWEIPYHHVHVFSFVHMNPMILYVCVQEKGVLLEKVILPAYWRARATTPLPDIAHQTAHNLHNSVRICTIYVLYMLLYSVSRVC